MTVIRTTSHQYLLMPPITVSFVAFACGDLVPPPVWLTAQTRRRNRPHEEHADTAAPDVTLILPGSITSRGGVGALHACRSRHPSKAANGPGRRHSARAGRPRGGKPLRGRARLRSA